MILTTLFFLFAVGMGVRAQRRKAVTGSEGLIGEEGEAVEAFRKGEGQVMVHGEIWKAQSEEKILKGDKVVVTEVKGLKLIVKKVT